MFYTGSLVFPAGAGSGPDLSGVPGADIHDSKRRLANWERAILKAKQSGGNSGDIGTSVLARNLMSVSSSMLNIELEQAEFPIYVFRYPDAV